MLLPKTDEYSGVEWDVSKTFDHPLKEGEVVKSQKYVFKYFSS